MGIGDRAWSFYHPANGSPYVWSYTTHVYSGNIFFQARNTTISAANAIQKRIAGSISDDDIPSNSASSKRITLSNASRLRILPPSLTPCRIPIFVDSPRPIRSSQIRRFNGSSVSMRLADIRPCNGRFRPGRPTRIPLFQNSPKPIRIEQVLSH